MGCKTCLNRAFLLPTTALNSGQATGHRFFHTVGIGRLETNNLDTQAWHLVAVELPAWLWLIGCTYYQVEDSCSTGNK